MKCELMEGLSGFLVAICFCALLILPATIAGCADQSNPTGTAIETEDDVTLQPAVPGTTDPAAVQDEQTEIRADETDLSAPVP